MTAAELLEQLESQTHGERVAAMIALGRQAGAEGRAIVAQLEQGNVYERMLALYSCFGSRDSAHALRALNDPSRLMRGLATRLAPHICNESELLAALPGVPFAARPQLLARLRRHGLVGVIDRYLDLRETQADTRFCALLPFGSSAAVARYMPRFAERATSGNWRALARLHPEVVLDHLLRQANAATGWDGPLITRVNDLLPLLVKSKANAPQAADLVSALTHVMDLSTLVLQPLIRWLPETVADLLLAGDPDQSGRLSWLRERVRGLSTEQIIAIYRRSQYAFGWSYEWFGKLAPDQRRAVFAACEPLFRRGQTVPEAVMTGLPRDMREQEARRVVSSSQIHLNVRLSYARYLPWDEMMATISPYLHASVAVTRQTALSALIQAAMFHRSRLIEALGELRERRTEQDGTRLVMLRALNALPQSAWKPEHLPLLAEVIRHGLNDVGLSSGTLQQVVSLLLKLMPAHEEWAADQLATVLRERGWKHSSTRTNLPPAVELSLGQTLLPQLNLWAAREDDEAALSVVQAIFVRPATFALALPLLDHLLQRTSNRAHIESALTLIAERAHGGLASRIPALLAADASWMTFPVVSSWLLRHRQDLLTPYLDLQPIAGRWGTGRRQFLLPLAHPFGGGTTRQQERLANAALARIADETNDTYAITEAIKLLSLLPVIDPGRIAALADDPRSVVRTTALFALAHLDTAGGAPTLIAALQDSRARIAIHALRSILWQMPIGEALTLLRSVPFERVTVAKEVVRLVSEFDEPAAWEQLVAYSQQDLHRDVRIALLQSLDRHLERPQAWEMLQAAARDADATVAQATVSLPSLSAYTFAERSSQVMQKRTLGVVAILLDHGDYSVRSGCQDYCQRLGIADEDHVVIPKLLARIHAAMSDNPTEEVRDEGIGAIQALCGVCAAADSETIATLMRALLPHRHALNVMTDELDDAPNFKQRQLLPVVRAALGVLADDPLVAGKCIELALSHLPKDELAAFLLNLAGQPGLHASTVAQAARDIRNLSSRYSEGELEALELALAGSDDPQIRWLAFKVFQAREDKAGERNETLAARLAAYRNDPAPLVASEAQFDFTDEETF